MSLHAAGALAIAIVCAVTYLGFAKRLPWAGDWEIRAVFSSANELHANSPVRVAGVDVGRVTGVERGPGGTTVVTMAIDEEGRPLHADATAKIRPRIFLEGNFFVDLRPGTPGAAALDEGGVIPMSQTAIPVQLDEVLATLNSSTRDQLQDVVREYATALEGGGARALNRGYADWAGAFQGTAATAEALRGPRTHDLSRLVAAAGAVSATLAERRTELASLISGFNTTLGALADRRAEVGASVRGLAGLLRASPDALRAVDDAVPSLRRFTAQLRPSLRAAPATIDLAVPLLVQLRSLLSPGEVPALVADLRPAVRTLAGIEPRLGALFDLVTPVTECVRRNALPTLTSTLQDDHLTTGQPAWQELLHGMVGLASASQNFDGNGPSVRYHGGYGDQLFSTGSVPGLGTLFGLSSQPLVGSRPAWPGPGRQPPFRPDVACSTQTPPNLAAPARAPVSASRAGHLAPLSPASRALARRLMTKRAPR
ncbi:MAG: phospholipid/cholesterol/gamma-HCH transport system substrate-binding protein [Solirubrobacteraceae bacterium]|jgi:ABC-type transporter Mla subunit MlaD|nr:phospholipid/cholesterol/gamma-HCH transport system substrate-binding protein [Solirubrobacteraceae bacterium]